MIKKNILQNKTLLNTLTYLGVIIISIAFLIIGGKNNSYSLKNPDTQTFEKAKVISIINKSEVLNMKTDYFETYDQIIMFKAKMLSGENKDALVTVKQIIDGMIVPQLDEVEEGDHILTTYFAEVPGEEEWIFVQFDRTIILLWLIISFLVIILIIGKLKGLTSIFSLLFSICSIFMVYIPSILSGKNIYVLTIVVSTFIIIISLVIINGVNKKTLCAIVGNLGGVIIAGGLGVLFSKLLDITGVIDQNYTFLMMISDEISIDLIAVVWGGIVIGSLGAIMDVAMSISSAMKELSDTMRDKTIGNMIKSGMNIGKDAIGTMTNTLILAYVGSSLAVILLFTAYNKDLLYLLNLEMFIVEILQAIVGSMGILFAVPVTVFFCAYVFNKKPKKEKQEVL